MLIPKHSIISFTAFLLSFSTMITSLQFVLEAIILVLWAQNFLQWWIARASVWIGVWAKTLIASSLLFPYSTHVIAAIYLHTSDHVCCNSTFTPSTRLILEFPNWEILSFLFLNSINVTFISSKIFMTLMVLVATNTISILCNQKCANEGVFIIERRLIVWAFLPSAWKIKKVFYWIPIGIMFPMIGWIPRVVNQILMKRLWSLKRCSKVLVAELHIYTWCQPGYFFFLGCMPLRWHYWWFSKWRASILGKCWASKRFFRFHLLSSADYHSAIGKLSNLTL